MVVIGREPWAVTVQEHRGVSKRKEQLMVNSHGENKCETCARHNESRVNLQTGLKICFSASVQDGDVCCKNWLVDSERYDAPQKERLEE